MIALRELMSGPVAEAIGWAILHSLWQGGLIALILYTVLRQMSGRSSEARYLLSVCALAVMLLLPVATGWEILEESKTRTGFLGEPSSAAVAMGSDLSVPLARESESRTSPGGILVMTREAAASSLPLVVMLWTAGVSLFSLRLLAGWLRLRAMVAEQVQAPAHLREMMNSLADRLEIWQPLRMLQSRLVDVPTVIGWFEPVILIPVSALSGLSREQLETILAHELAHIRRHDYAVNLAQTAVETLFFYHPAAFWISRQIRIERENCCDDLAVAVCGDPVVHARALAMLEQLRSAPGPAISASGGSLLLRVRRLLSRPESRCSTKWVAGVSVLTIAAAILIAAPLTMLAFSREASVPAGTSITVTASAEPEELVPPAGELAHGFPVETDCESESEQTLLAEYDELDAGSPVIEVSDLTELFRLEDITNGSVRIALFGIDAGTGEESERQTGEDARRFTSDEMLKLRHAGVGSAYLESLRRAGFTTLTSEEIVALFTNGVSADYAARMASAGLGRHEPMRLLALHRNGVRPDLVDALQEFGIDDSDDLVSAAVHGITPSWLKAMQEAGISGGDVGPLIAMRNHGVDPKLVSAIRALGLDDDSDETIVSMTIHGVTPSFVDELRKAGYSDLDAEELISLKIHGVSAGRIRELRAVGFEDLDVEEVIAARIHGVTPAFIDEIRKEGFRDIDLDELIALRVHGIDADWIREQRAAGIVDLDVDHLISIRIHERDHRSRTRH